MKAMNSISSDLFFNPAAAVAGTWHEQSRPVSRERASALRLALIEQQGYKQEAVCSVILVLCLLFSLAVCIAQLATS